MRRRPPASPASPQADAPRQGATSADASPPGSGRPEPSRLRGLYCLATYGERLAALLENASELRLYELREGGLVSRGFTPMPRGGPSALVETLLASGGPVLICGGISGQQATHLKAAGIRTLPWTCGDLDQVAAALRDGSLDRLRMPGRRRR